MLWARITYEFSKLQFQSIDVLNIWQRCRVCHSQHIYYIQLKWLKFSTTNIGFLSIFWHCWFDEIKNNQVIWQSVPLIPKYYLLWKWRRIMGLTGQLKFMHKMPTRQVYKHRCIQTFITCTMVEHRGLNLRCRWLLVANRQYMLTPSKQMIQHSLLCSFWKAFDPSVAWHCWLGSWKVIRLVKNWVVGCGCGYLSGARFRHAFGSADATAIHCLLLERNPDRFYFSGTNSPG